MDRRGVITLLAKEPGEKSVQIAVDWIKRQKDGSPRVGLVLQKLLEIPEFESHLSWLSNYVKVGILNFLTEKMPYLDISLQTYNRVIHLINDNLAHRHCGEVLNSLLHSYSDDRLLEISRHWLLNHSAHDDDAAAGVASYLLRTDRTNEVVSKATELVMNDQQNRPLIVSMLEYTDNTDVENVALKLLPNDPCIAAALLKRGSKFKPIVQDTINKKQKRNDVRTWLSIIMSYEAEKSAIVFDWIQSHPASAEVPHFLQDLLLMTPSDEIVSYAWNWFNKQAAADQSIDFVLSLLYVQNAIYPPEAITYASDWARTNISHQRWLAVVQQLIVLEKSDARQSLAEFCLTNCQLEQRGPILLALIRNPGAPDSLQKARLWLKELGPNAQDSLVASMVIELIRNSPDADLIDQAKKLISTADIYAAGILLITLLESGDVDSKATAKDWISTPRIERRWGGVHCSTGQVLISLLKIAPHDQEILSKAKNWLHREVESYDIELKQKVQQTYVKALTGGK
jgi:hypothetical protein